MKRTIAFAYALACYAVFFVTLLYAVGFLGNFGVSKTIDAQSETSIPVALAIDAALLTLFALQHSIMARPWFKRAWTRLVPEPAERSTYVLFSSLALLLLFWAWQPIGIVVWDALHNTTGAFDLSTLKFLNDPTVRSAFLNSFELSLGSAAFGAVSPDDSLFAALARAIAPIFDPAGFGDWHTVGALVVGFVAKEAVLTSWAQTYAAADPTTGLPPDQLKAHVSAAFTASSGGAVTAAVLAFLVFLLAYTPCVATVAAQRREIGLRWTAFGISLQLGVAWTVAVAVFQLGRLIS